MIQYSFAGLLFVLIGVTLYVRWKSLAGYSWELNYRWLVLSLLLASGGPLSLAVWWVTSIRLMKGSLGWAQGTHIWVYAQLAKYLPGGIWPYASRMVAAGKAGVPRSCAALSLVVETVLRVQAAIIVFLVSLPFWPMNRWSPGQLTLIAIALLASFALLDPRLLNKVLGLGSRALRRPAVSITSLEYKHLVGLLAGHILTLVGVGSAFYALVSSVHAMSASAALPLTGMLAIAVILGFLNPLTPQGLGTREGLLTLFLSYYMPLPVAIVIALLTRLWMIVAELIGVLLVALLLRVESSR